LLQPDFARGALQLTACDARSFSLDLDRRNHHRKERRKQEANEQPSHHHGL